MGFMDALLRGMGAAPETRAVSGISNPEGWLMGLLGAGEESYSGKSVTPESALRLIPVYAAVARIAGDVGATPLHVYRRRRDGGRDRATDFRLYRALHEQPNDYMDAGEFWELLTAHVLLWGNGFAAKGRGPDGLVRELVPLSPKDVQVGEDAAGRPMYAYKGKTVGPEGILHFRGLGVDGKLGLSPIQQARQALGNGLALEEFQGRFWRNNARPGGVLKHPGELSEKAQKRLRGTWDVLQGGLVNAGKTAILEEGMEWESLGLPLVDAQFIEQTKATRSDVALLFQLPPHMLNADSGATLRYENTESQGIDYARSTLRRWFRRHEGALKRDADLFIQARAYYPEFLMDAWMRADSRSRAEFYSRALDPVKGWMETDEVRERENMNPLSDEQRRRREALAAKTKTGDDGGDGPQEGDDGE